MPTLPLEPLGGSRAYRILHSSGEELIEDLATALRRLATLPGAKLFVMPAPAKEPAGPAAPEASPATRSS